MRPAEALDAEEAAAVARVGRDPEVVRVAGLARRFTGIVRTACQADAKGGDVAEPDAWLAEARSCGVAAVETFAAGLEQDGAAVRAALTTPWSTGQAEGQINRLKLLKREMYGRSPS